LITTEFIARLCHEANKVVCETDGDFSQPSWDDAPDWQKESAINGVEYHLDNPLATPEDSHVNWMKQKVADGWTYGDVKDADAKTHPCMVEYSELPAAQQMKDYMFIAIVRIFSNYR
jgi:hypothetical protein